VDSSRRIIHGVDPIFQWNRLVLRGIFATFIDAIRSNDSNILGGPMDLCV